MILKVFINETLSYLLAPRKKNVQSTSNVTEQQNLTLFTIEVYYENHQ